MSAPFRKIHGVLCFSQLILAQSTFGQHGEKWVRAAYYMKYDVTWLLSHSGYVSIYDIKMENPIMVSFRKVPWQGAGVHLCPFLFLFSLSLLRVM